MASEELKEFVEERLLAYDPDIDLTEGSPAQDQVVDPIVERFNPDPFEMDVDKFIAARLTQEYPDMNVREGSGLRDTLVKPNQILMDPLSREVQLIKQGQSFANPDLLAPSEADSLAANLFVTRQTGGLSTGTVRLYFNAPVAVNISVGNVCFTSDGLRFLPTTLQSISAEAMLFNQSGSLFYFDIQVTAEDAGEEYNVEKNSIVGITNLNVAVRVDNLEKFSGGINEESTDDLVARAETEITERSLVVARGVSARLNNQFDDLVHLQIVGMFDADMQRDILTGGELGPVLIGGNDGYTTDDGDGDALTSSFYSRDADFVSFFGASGPVDGYWLTYSEYITAAQNPDGEVTAADLSHFRINGFSLDGAQFEDSDVGLYLVTWGTNPLNVGAARILAVVDYRTVKLDRTGAIETGLGYVLVRAGKDVEIDEADTLGELKLKTAISSHMNYASWTVRQKVLTISDIPGGILYEDGAEIVDIQAGEVHIGGCTDFYVRGTGVSQEESVVEAVTDEQPLIESDSGVSDATSDEKKEFIQDSSKDFAGEGVTVGMSLIVETGVDAGTKTILAVGVAPGGVESEDYLQVTPAFTSTAAGLRYKIIDDIDVNLTGPRTIRRTGTDAQTIQLSDVVTTSSALDFVSVGAEEGDIFELLDGRDKGKYTVKGISGTGNKYLQISGQLAATADNLGWELYKEQAGVDLPLVRVRSIDLLDSSNQPTGDTIPYSEPVDVRTEAFSNAGLGTKVSAIDAITGIVGIVDMNGLLYPMSPTVLSISINDEPDIDITLTGAASKSDLINQINAAIPQLADTIEVDGEDRIVLRSRDRWVRLEPEASSSGTGYANIGLDPLGEDNRQIKSLNSITDWTSSAYGLNPIKDVVSITTGNNIGQLYLVAVQPGKLLALSFDESTGRARFLQPDASVHLSVGSRSYGTARIYFIDPTSFEVYGAWRPWLRKTADFPANKAFEEAGGTILDDEPQRTIFTATVGETELRFFPDPDLFRQILPTPEDDIPNNMKTAASDNTVVTEAAGDPVGDLGKNSRDADADFLTGEVRAGDKLDLTYQPLQGDNDLNGLSWGPSGSLDGKTLILALDGAPSKSMTFSDQLATPSDVRDEINAAFGETIAFLETIAGADYIRLEADFEIILSKNSTSVYDGGALLWTAPIVVNQYNTAVDRLEGYYTITKVGAPLGGDRSDHDTMEVSPAPTNGGQAQHYRVLRPGVQRIHSTEMNANLEFGLYYVDVELVSEGSGNDWNLSDETVMVVEGHDSDGYRLRVVDSNRSYSEEEEVFVEFTRRFLTVGSSDSPDAATPIYNQNVQINYDRSPLASQIQSFSTSELERVLNASILVRHLQPHYLNFDINYRGGSSADIVKDDILAYLDSLGPTERVESSELTKVVNRRQATYVAHPITLVAVVHDEERKITVERSEDFVTHGSLATFFDDVINVIREDSTAL